MWKLIATAAVSLLFTAQALANGVGYRQIAVDDPMGGEMTVSVWYPTEVSDGRTSVGPFEFDATAGASLLPGRHGLVVLSHGSGGSNLGHYNIGIELARLGIVAVAPRHPRNNSRDNNGVGRRVVLEGRPRQVSTVIDVMLESPEWGDRIDPDRIGAFGFSIGGYTVLSLLGAKPDFSVVSKYCEQNEADPFCRFEEVFNEAVRNAQMEENLLEMPDMGDARICAAVIADPVAVIFPDAEIMKIESQFLEFWRPEEQNELLADAHVSRVVRLLNKRPGSKKVAEIMVPGSQHYSFIAPFPPSLMSVLPAMLTRDAPGFDRNEFQNKFAPDVADFLFRNLSQCS